MGAGYKVLGLSALPQVRDYHTAASTDEELTAEMLVNADKDAAAYVIRSLACYPRSLIAKRAMKDPMYALEPCKTRPNSLKQKTIDGETVYVGTPGPVHGLDHLGGNT